MRAHVASHRGFTLVELMVVVAIVTVLLAVAGYSLGASGRGLSADAFARSVHFLALRARADAAADGFQRRISCIASRCTFEQADAAHGGMALVPAASWLDAGVDIQGGTAGQVWAFDPAPQAQSQVVGVGPLAGVQRIVFYPDGTSSGGTLFFSDKSKQHQHKVFVYRATAMPRMLDQW